MTARILATIVAALSLFGLRNPKTDDIKIVTKELSAQYTRFMGMFRKKNIDGMAAMMTPDYAARTKSGQRLDSRQALDILRAQAGQIREIGTARVRITRLQVKSGAATALVATSMVYDLADGIKTHHVEAEGISKDVWIRMPAGWRLKGSMEIETRTRVDGKPLIPPAEQQPVFTPGR